MGFPLKIHVMSFAKLKKKSPPAFQILPRVSTANPDDNDIKPNQKKAEKHFLLHSHLF